MNYKITNDDLFVFDNMGFLDLKIPKPLYESLKSECDIAFNCNGVFESGLTGAGVPHHRWVESKSNLRDLEIFIFSLLQGYKETFKLDPIRDIWFHSQSPVFKMSRPWINYQKKHEFIPNHIHDGTYSYTIWIDIPYDSHEELKDGDGYASCFHFHYTDILGESREHLIRLSKRDNGRMLFFPSQLRHQVYPFYTSDKYRISISGNVLLDIKINN